MASESRWLRAPPGRIREFVRMRRAFVGHKASQSGTPYACSPLAMRPIAVAMNSRAPGAIDSTTSIVAKLLTPGEAQLIFHWIVLLFCSALGLSINVAPTGSVDRLEVCAKIFAAGGGRSRNAPGKVTTCSPPPHVAPGSRIESSCSVSCPIGNQLASIETVPGHGAVAPADGRAVKIAVTTPPCKTNVKKQHVKRIYEVQTNR
eukprot:SAG31_NODE_378_length_16503_cov_28.830041_15_plen_204_part_00